jgi:lipoprotein-releasing system permease protein
VSFGINFRFVYRVSLRYLFSSRLDKSTSLVSFFAVFGVGLGVFALIVVMSVMNGFRADLISSIVASSGEITIRSFRPVSNYKQLVSQIDSLPFVKSIKPVVMCYSMAEFGMHRRYVLVKGIDTVKLKLERGSNDFLNNICEIAVSKNLAQSLGLNIGSKISLVNLESILQEDNFCIKEFTVKAIFFDCGDDSSLILTSLDSASTLFEKNKGVSVFEVETINPDNAEKFTQHIKSKILSSDYSIGNWKQSNPDLLRALEIENVSMFIILSLIVLVAVSNAFSSLVMTVKEKVYEIAILRTIGASRLEILLIFIFNGLAIGMLGVFSGAIFAFLLILNIPFIKKVLSFGSNIGICEVLWHFFDKMPVSVNTMDILSIIVFASILSLISTLYPAYKAAKIEPATVLK